MPPGVVLIFFTSAAVILFVGRGSGADSPAPSTTGADSPATIGILPGLNPAAPPVPSSDSRMPNLLDGAAVGVPSCANTSLSLSSISRSRSCENSSFGSWSSHSMCDTYVYAISLPRPKSPCPSTISPDHWSPATISETSTNSLRSYMSIDTSAPWKWNLYCLNSLLGSILPPRSPRAAFHYLHCLREERLPGLVAYLA